MIIQIQSKWFSLVLMIGDQEEKKSPPPPHPTRNGDTQLPVGTEEARSPKIIGLVK